MKKINNIFDCLENAEGRDMERITRNTPQLDEKQLERLLDMSERKYNIKKRNEITAESSSNDDYQTTAEGVETYKRPVWFRFGAAAAALILTGGIAAAGLKILKNRNEVPNVPSIPNVAATSVTTDAVTTDKANADSTTVTVDISATVTGSETTYAASETVSSEQAAQTSQPSSEPSVAVTEVQQTTSAAASANALTEEQCYDIIDMETDYHLEFEELISIPCRDYLDFSDTFTATVRVTHDTFSEGHPLLDEPNEFTIKYVHYVDPRYQNIDDIRNFIIFYNKHWFGGRYSYTEQAFDQLVVPDQVLTYDLYITEMIYGYTVYNGKVYRAVSNDLAPESYTTHDDFYTSEHMALRWGHDYIRNITDTSFEAYRITEDGDGGYRGRYRYYYYDGTNWNMDSANERDISDAECRQILSY